MAIFSAGSFNTTIQFCLIKCRSLIQCLSDSDNNIYINRNAILCVTLLFSCTLKIIFRGYYLSSQGIHINIINAFLDFCEDKWGNSARKTLIKLNNINEDEIQGLQNYLPQEVLYGLINTIQDEFNQSNYIYQIGKYCANGVLKESVYFHPILSLGSPIRFLKESNSLFNIFFPKMQIQITYKNANKFRLSLPSQKNKLFQKWLNGFLDEIIIRFSKSAKLKIKFQKNDTKKNIIHYNLKYINIKRRIEDLTFNITLILVIIIIGYLLYFFKTDYHLIILIIFLSYFSLRYPFTIYISRNRSKYHRSLISELNVREKQLLDSEEISFLEILELKSFIQQLKDLGLSILKCESIDDIIERIVLNSKLLLHSDKAVIYFYDKHTHTFYTKDKYAKENISFHAEEGITSKIGKIKRPIILNDPYSNPYFNKQLDKVTGSKTRNLIGCPILNLTGELYGVLEVSNKTNDRQYSKIDLDVLTTIANYASLALQKTLSQRDIIDQEHKRLMDTVSYYFSKKEFKNLLNIDTKISKQDRKLIGKNLLQFYRIFLNNININNDKNLYNMLLDYIEKNSNIKLTKLSEYPEKIDNILLAECLHILIKNSQEAAQAKNIAFNCEIYYLDQINIIGDITKNYGISEGISKWNNRTIDLGSSFINFISDTFPLMEDQLEKIEKAVSYKPRIRYLDFCGGMDSDIQDKIFYPFFSTKSNHDGLGLNLLKSIVDMNDGRIEFNNMPEKGVEINIYFS